MPISSTARLPLTRTASAQRRLRRPWRCGPRTDRMDPYALRAAILLVLVAAVLAAGGDVRERLRAAFSPAATATPALLRLDAWVTPPVYTGIAPSCSPTAANRLA